MTQQEFRDMLVVNTECYLASVEKDGQVPWVKDSEQWSAYCEGALDITEMFSTALFFARAGQHALEDQDQV